MINKDIFKFRTLEFEDVFYVMVKNQLISVFFAFLFAFQCTQASKSS